MSQYFLELIAEGLVCIGIAMLLNAQKQRRTVAKRKIEQVVVIATCVASALTGRFLLPASLGLIARPFPIRAKEQLINWIFGFSAFLIGALAVGVPLNWGAGVALGATTFFIAQPLVSALFIRDSKSDLIRVMAGHQNGMTAILLTIALELRIGSSQLLAITLPAIIAIACFYYAVNYCLEQFYLQLATSSIRESEASQSEADRSAEVVEK